MQQIYMRTLKLRTLRTTLDVCFWSCLILGIHGWPFAALVLRKVLPLTELHMSFMEIKNNPSIHTTSFQRRYDVCDSARRRIDVETMSCVYWNCKYIKSFKQNNSVWETKSDKLFKENDELQSEAAIRGVL